MHENDIVKKVIDLSFKIHKNLGPGLLENMYQNCLVYELQKLGYQVEKEKALPVIYETIKMECGYRVDILIDNKVVVEVKSINSLLDIHLAQLLTYLRIGKFKLGLLINFNSPLLKDGIKRVIN
jgi:GxxExxY protein